MKSPSIKNKRKSKHYKGGRTTLTVMCDHCMKQDDQESIINCLSCHSGYHTYCMPNYSQWTVGEEYFCQKFIVYSIFNVENRLRRQGLPKFICLWPKSGFLKLKFFYLLN